VDKYNPTTVHEALIFPIDAWSRAPTPLGGDRRYSPIAIPPPATPPDRGRVNQDRVEPCSRATPLPRLAYFNAL
jgi:hypothetical protein